MKIVQLNLKRPAKDSVLRQQAKTLDPLDPLLPELLEKMHAGLTQTGGVGLAAPQIGISRQLILVKHGTRPAGQPHRVEAYLNPELEWSSEETVDDYEGCLSIGEGGGLVPRALRVRVRFQRPGSAAFETLELADYDARIMQHELDHLAGRLFIDRMKGELIPMEEARRLRDEGHRARGWLPPE